MDDGDVIVTRSAALKHRRTVLKTFIAKRVRFYIASDVAKDLSDGSEYKCGLKSASRLAVSVHTAAGYRLKENLGVVC